MLDSWPDRPSRNCFHSALCPSGRRVATWRYASANRCGAAFMFRTAARQRILTGEPMARIPFVTANEVPANERAAYDAFVQQRNGQPQAGPYALMLHMPEL